MPYVSDAQRKYFNANREKLEAQGVDVKEWNDSSRGKKLLKRKGPEKLEKTSCRTLYTEMTKSASKQAAIQAIKRATARFMEKNKEIELYSVLQPDSVEEPTPPSSCNAMQYKNVKLAQLWQHLISSGQTPVQPQAHQQLTSMMKPKRPVAPVGSRAKPVSKAQVVGAASNNHISPAQNPINAYGPLNQAGTVGGGMFGQKQTEGGSLKLSQWVRRKRQKQAANLDNTLGKGLIGAGLGGALGTTAGLLDYVLQKPKKGKSRKFNWKMPLIGLGAGGVLGAGYGGYQDYQNHQTDLRRAENKRQRQLEAENKENRVKEEEAKTPIEKLRSYFDENPVYSRMSPPIPHSELNEDVPTSEATNTYEFLRHFYGKDLDKQIAQANEQLPAAQFIFSEGKPVASSGMPVVPRIAVNRSDIKKLKGVGDSEPFTPKDALKDIKVPFPEDYVGKGDKYYEATKAFHDQHSAAFLTPQPDAVDSVYTGKVPMPRLEDFPTQTIDELRQLSTSHAPTDEDLLKLFAGDADAKQRWEEATHPERLRNWVAWMKRKQARKNTLNMLFGGPTKTRNPLLDVNSVPPLEKWPTLHGDERLLPILYKTPEGKKILSELFKRVVRHRTAGSDNTTYA